MGRKKSKRTRQTTRRPARVLETVFDCPFCSFERSCVTRIIPETAIGKISCCECKEEFQTRINHLTAPIDIFNEWIDACETTNN